jgi:hypothetical protein
LPASSASFQVRISGRPLPKLISSMMRTCSGGDGRAGVHGGGGGKSG